MLISLDGRGVEKLNTSDFFSSLKLSKNKYGKIDMPAPFNDRFNNDSRWYCWCCCSKHYN